MDTTIDPTIKALASAIGQAETGASSPEAYQKKGASGEFGRYQFMPETYKLYAGKYLGDANAQPTVENQNKIAYSFVKDKKDAGFNPAQIASMWNAGESKPDAYKQGWKGDDNGKGVAYDTPAYVQRVSNYYNQLKGGQSPDIMAGQMANAGTPHQPDTYGALFPYQQGDNPVVAGAKAIGNVPSSIYNLGKGIFDVASHPIDSAVGIGRTAIGGVQALTGQSNPNDINTQAFHALTGALSDRYGSMDNLARTATNDPFGIGLDILSVLTGGAAAVGRSAELASTLGKVGELATIPVDSALQGVSNIATKTAKYTAARATGLDSATIAQILKTPEEFSAAQIASASRADLANVVKDALGTRQSHLEDTGAGYSGIRDLQAENLRVASGDAKTIDLGKGKQLVYNLPDAPNELLDVPELRRKMDMLKADPNTPSDVIKGTQAELDLKSRIETVPHEVKVSKNFIENAFKTAAGVAFKDGQAFATGSSAVREAKDVRAVQALYDMWKPVFAKGTLTTTEYLNFRSDLAKMAKFDRELTKSAPLENLAGIIRANFNAAYRPQIPGLKTLDARYEEEISQIKELRQGLIDKEGNLTSSAINKIANATGKGKDLLLERLEKIVPGITHKIQIQKAIEDIQGAMQGRQVGAYTKSAVETGSIVGAATGLTTGNIPLAAASIAMTIMTAPGTAVPIMRTFGFSKPLVKAVIANLKDGMAARPITAPAADVLSAVGQQGQTVASLGSSTGIPTQ